MQGYPKIVQNATHPQSFIVQNACTKSRYREAQIRPNDSR